MITPQHYHFIASDDFDIVNFKTVEAFVNAYADVQSVYMTEVDILQLLALLGLTVEPKIELKDSFLAYYYDLSACRLPEFSKEEMDCFYEQWIEVSGRENTMDEYGSLVFLKGLMKEWNERNYRMLVMEDIEK